MVVFIALMQPQPPEASSPLKYSQKRHPLRSPAPFYEFLIPGAPLLIT